MPPQLAQQRNPAMSPHTKGKEQAPVTLENNNGEKKPTGTTTTTKPREGRRGGGGGRKWLKEPHGTFKLYDKT